MKKFHEFTQIYPHKSVNIRLDTIIVVFENKIRSSNPETVIHLINGKIFVVEESMDEVMKILKEGENNGD